MKKKKISENKLQISQKDYDAGVILIDKMLRLYSTMPKEYQTTLLFQLSEMTGVKGKELKKVEENCELPWSWDVLENICKALDFDDLLRFSSVCKNWRAVYKIYFRNFMQYQEPLLLQIRWRHLREDSFSLISISDQKVYCFKMMECYFYSRYLMSSGGYFVKSDKFERSFLLINPFTRIEKVIKASTAQSFTITHGSNHALLAFSKCSKGFVLVVLCTHSDNLHVYQSRYRGWFTFSSKIGNQESVVHFVVLHNIIYVVTNEANIGVLSLKSLNIKFLTLTSTPDVTNKNFKLVNCDEQLLVVDLMDGQIRNVYKIDFSAMNYVKLETLGNIALFYNVHTWKSNCYALSNPKKWGYESNSVYVTTESTTRCKVYSGDDKKLQKCITLPTPRKSNQYIYDWCFKHLQHKIDYSLVE